MREPELKLPGGELEYAVLYSVCELRSASARDIYAQVGQPPGLAYTTIAKVLDRLRVKGLVERRRRGKLFVYRPRIARQVIEFTRARVSLSKLLGLRTSRSGRDPGRSNGIAGSGSARRTRANSRGAAGDPRWTVSWYWRYLIALLCGGALTLSGSLDGGPAGHVRGPRLRAARVAPPMASVRARAYNSCHAGRMGAKGAGQCRAGAQLPALECVTVCSTFRAHRLAGTTFTSQP